MTACGAHHPARTPKRALACLAAAKAYISLMMNRPDGFFTDSGAAAARAPAIAHARFGIGDVVRHRIFEFRGVIFDVEPVFANSEEWYQAIPEEIRPSKDQPFYHLLAENAESSYLAYISQQNLLH